MIFHYRSDLWYHFYLSPALRGVTFIMIIDPTVGSLLMMGSTRCLG